MTTQSSGTTQISAEVTAGSGFDTGAFLPKDMTVRLVRADAAAWEIFISVLYSFVLTAFGIFLGSWITDAHSQQPKFTSLEKAAVIILGVIALILAGAWVVIKYRQGRRALKVPLSVLCGQDPS